MVQLNIWGEKIFKSSYADIASNLEKLRPFLEAMRALAIQLFCSRVRGIWLILQAISQRSQK